jgi:hypothetical protein
MTCGECFTIGFLCGAMSATAALVIALALVLNNRPRVEVKPEEDSVLG